MHKALQQLRIQGACSLSEHDAAVAVTEVVQFRREISLHDRRSLTGNGLPHVLFIYIHEFQLLAVCGFLVSLIKMRRRSAASDDQERAANAARDQILPNPAAVSQGEGKKKSEAQKQHTAARLHRLIERRRRINQHCADQPSCGDRKNVLGCITEGQLLDRPIVTANKVQCRYNHTELNKVDYEELKRRGIKRVISKPPCDSINSEPAHHI